MGGAAALVCAMAPAAAAASAQRAVPVTGSTVSSTPRESDAGGEEGATDRAAGSSRGEAGADPVGKRR